MANPNAPRRPPWPPHDGPRQDQPGWTPENCAQPGDTPEQALERSRAARVPLRPS